MKLSISNKFITTIIGYGSNGEGVAKYQDYTVFVGGVIVGEVVEVKATYVKKNICYARLVNVVEKSPNRVKPPCKYYGKCGGCQLQHMDYETQLQLKLTMVKNSLQKIGGLNLDVLPTVASTNNYNYRNKISLPVGGEVGNVTVGMYKQNTHEIIDIENCLITEQWADKLIEVVRNYLNQNNVVPYNQATFSGEIRHVVARQLNNQLLITLVSNGAYNHNLAPLTRSLQKEFGDFGLFVNINTSKNNVILGDTTQHIFGLKELTDTHNGINYFVQPQSFFQVNNSVKNAIYSKAKDLLQTSNVDAVVDCFSGVGVLTSALYSSSYKTYAIEIVSDAVADANKLAAQNKLTNLTNICGDVNTELPKLMDALQGQQTALVVDPPRKGLGENICNTILTSAPSQIIYISCDPATLARDLSQLTLKYDIAYIQPYDMFPQTKHVETLVCLKRK